MDRFSKPYFSKIFGLRPRPARHPYPLELFIDRDCFKISLQDGGQFFCMMDNLGSTSGAAWLEALEDGRLLASWMRRGKLDWDKVYDDTIAKPRRVAIEKHVWMQRLYFLLPVAQAFLRTRDEKYAKMWFGYFQSWHKAHPYPRRMDKAAQPTKYAWWDMQVTFRFINIMQSAYLLAGSAFLDRAKWRAIYESIRLHAKHVHAEAASALEKNSGRGNHFLQKANALTYFAMLFPEFPESAGYLRTARAVTRQQMGTEILSDGGSIEASPSYSHFIARLYLDIHLLLKKNRAPAIPGLEASLRRQYRWLGETASPAGCTLPLSDGYYMDADADLALVRSLYPLPRPGRRKSVVFPQSVFAVLRRGPWAAYVDGMSQIMGHPHPGKPQVLAFFNGKSLIIDSGCPNYDSQIWLDWYRRAAAHDVVVVTPAKPPKHLIGEDPTWQALPVVRVKRFNSHEAVFTHRLSMKGFRYDWTRAVRLTRQGLEVRDLVTAPAAVDARQVFHFAPMVARLDKKDPRRGWAQMSDGTLIEFRGGAPWKLEHRPAMGEDNRPAASAEISSVARGRRLVFTARFCLK
jgi:hypothetical protein